MEGLAITELTFGYAGPKDIFHDASFELRKGVDLIMGPSGCGKTTLLKILSGVIPIAETERQLPPGRRLLVIQEDALLPWLTGWENLDLFLGRGAPSRSDIERHEAYSAVADFIDQKAWQMSYGQRRSIELLRALIFRPRLLFLDEPLNYIDADRRAVFAAAFYNATGVEQILISTHEPDDFAPFAMDALVFDGRHPVKNLQRKPL